jgi:hypothetical protein
MHLVRDGARPVASLLPFPYFKLSRVKTSRLQRGCVSASRKASRPNGAQPPLGCVPASGRLRPSRVNPARCCKTSVWGAVLDEGTLDCVEKDDLVAGGCFVEDSRLNALCLGSREWFCGCLG